MRYILWVILGTNGTQPAPAVDHAEYENAEACQQAADQIKTLHEGVQFQIYTICTSRTKKAPPASAGGAF